MTTGNLIKHFQKEDTRPSLFVAALVGCSSSSFDRLGRGMARFTTVIAFIWLHLSALKSDPSNVQDPELAVFGHKVPLGLSGKTADCQLEALY